MSSASIKVLMKAVVSNCPSLLMFVSHLKKPLSNLDFNVANVVFRVNF